MAKPLCPLDRALSLVAIGADVAASAPGSIGQTFECALPAPAVAVVMVPVPAAATDAVMVITRMRETDADIGAKRADMRADADALAAGGRPGANGAHVGASVGLLCAGSAGKKQCG